MQHNTQHGCLNPRCSLSFWCFSQDRVVFEGLYFYLYNEMEKVTCKIVTKKVPYLHFVFTTWFKTIFIVRGIYHSPCVEFCFSHLHVEAKLFWLQMKSFIFFVPKWNFSFTFPVPTLGVCTICSLISSFHLATTSRQLTAALTVA